MATKMRQRGRRPGKRQSLLTRSQIADELGVEVWQVRFAIEKATEDQGPIEGDARAGLVWLYTRATMRLIAERLVSTGALPKARFDRVFHANDSSCEESPAADRQHDPDRDDSAPTE